MVSGPLHLAATQPGPVGETDRQAGEQSQQCHRGGGESEGKGRGEARAWGRPGRSSWRKGHVNGDKDEKQELAGHTR